MKFAVFLDVYPVAGTQWLTLVICSNVCVCERACVRVGGAVQAGDF